LRFDSGFLQDVREHLDFMTGVDMRDDMFRCAAIA